MAHVSVATACGHRTESLTPGVPDACVHDGFNTPLIPMDRSSKQKVNKETQVINDILDEMDLINIFRTFHPNAEEYTFFSRAHGAFSGIDHILGHKSNLSKFKKIEIISSMQKKPLKKLSTHGENQTPFATMLGV